MLRPISVAAHAEPPSPMRLQSPAICPPQQPPQITATGPAASVAQETRVPALPEQEGVMRAAYVTLAADDDLLQAIAGQCEAEAIELPCPQRLLVRVLAPTTAAHAQALAAVATFLRYHRPGLPARLRMVPIAQAGLVQGHVPVQGDGKGDVQCKEGAAAPPARLFPVFFFCVPSASVDAEEAEARVDKAVQRLETALRIHGGSSSSSSEAFLPESATMVVSPWGSLEPSPPPLSPQQHAQPQQPPSDGGSGIVRRVVPGRGTLHLLPTPPPAPLLDSLRLLRDYFGLDLTPGENLSEGRDFFQAWALATLGGYEHSGAVRAHVVATIAGRGELLEEAAESVRRALGGGTAKDHLLRVGNDMTLAGGQLEVQAAAIYDNVRVSVFDVDAQRLSTLAPPADSPLPAAREAALLHYQGAYWLLTPQASGDAGEMDMTLTQAMAATMALGGDLDASMASASQRMSEL